MSKFIERSRFTFYVLIAMILTSCNNAKKDFQHDRPDLSAKHSNQCELVLRFCSSEDPLRVAGAYSSDQSRVDLSWEAADIVHLAVVQNGEAHYLDCPITKKSNTEAHILVDHSAVNFYQLYDIYGYFGNGRWEDTSSSTPKVIIDPTQAYTTLDKAVKALPFIFSSVDNLGNTATADAKILGNLMAMELRNYTQKNQTIQSIGLSSAVANQTIAYDPKKEIKVDLTNNQVSGEKISTPVFSLPGFTKLPAGERGTLFVYFVGDRYGSSIRFVPRVITAEHDYTASPSLHQLSANLTEGKLYRITTLCVAGGVYTDHPIKPHNIPNPEQANYNWADWMKNYPDDYPVFKMLIPGTHDSEAVEFTGLLGAIGKGAAQCQETHIYDQMKAGVRALDIRLKKWYDDLYVAHGPTWTNVEFKKDVMDVMVRFLREHPTEAIFLMIANEGKADWEWWANKVASTFRLPQYYPFFAPKLDKNTTIGDIRGKIVLISRDNNIRGRFDRGIYFKNWGDNSSGRIAIMSPLYSGGEDMPVYIQDNYKGISKEDKVKTTMRTFRASIQTYYQGAWTINYSSLSGNPGKNAWNINRKLIESFDEMKIPYHGIIYTDFITRRDAQGFELMKRILSNPYHQR